MAVQKSDLHRNGNKTSRFRVTFGCAAVPVGFGASCWIVGSWPLGWAALPAVWGECEAAQGFFRGDCGWTNYIYLHHSFVSQLQVCLVCVYVESFCGLAHSVDWLGNSNGGKDTWGELVKIDGKFIQLYLGVTRLQLRQLHSVFSEARFRFWYREIYQLQTFSVVMPELLRLGSFSIKAARPRIAP